MTTFLKCLFFSQNSTFLKFWKPIWLSIPRGLWPYNFFRDILILRGQNNENITREKIAKIRIAIWGLRSARIKKLKKTDPHFFPKKIRVCFLQLFDPSTPKASNRDPTSRDYIMRKFFKIWAPSNKNIWQFFLGHNPLGIVNHIGFINVKKLIIGWKIGTKQ